MPKHRISKCCRADYGLAQEPAQRIPERKKRRNNRDLGSHNPQKFLACGAASARGRLRPGEAKISPQSPPAAIAALYGDHPPVGRVYSTLNSTASTFDSTLCPGSSVVRIARRYRPSRKRIPTSRVQRCPRATGEAVTAKPGCAHAISRAQRGATRPVSVAHTRCSSDRKANGATYGVDSSSTAP